MTYRTSIAGSIVALVTPMTDDGAVDYAALDRLLEWHIDEGTDALVAVGTTGESATLEFAEHLAVIGHVVRTIDGRMPVLAGTGANATAEARYLTSEAFALGADACLLVTPYYNKPTQEGLFRHYEAIARAVDGPLFLYNVPGRTACDLLPQTVQRLLVHDNIVGIKEASGNQERIQQLLALDPSLVVISGDDATACESILMGARGDISVTANVAPALMHQMCSKALAGEAAQARELDKALQGLHRDLFVESSPIPVKWALARMQRIGQGIRLPLTPMTTDLIPRVEAAMRQAGVEF